ncbi:uncharacterized protein LOC117342592 [Pecten maximus]|uniref:uncharacterized protein LOC117342592 n=1 Tax=Pecten maximus TaxID=6579 RepID=UPI001458E54C|nr:uncharacterized protein LOC117342592 [Pecten maximus]
MPRYGAFYFTEDNTTGIAPLTIVTSSETIKADSEVTCLWDGKTVKAVVINISNSRALLQEKIDCYEPPEDHLTTTSPVGTTTSPVGTTTSPVVTTKSKKVSKKNNTSRSFVAQTLASGPAATPTVTDHVEPQEAAYQLDDDIQDIVDSCQDSTRSQTTQTSTAATFNNTTQTPISLQGTWNVSGRVSVGPSKRRLNPDKIEIVRREVFTYFPCLPSEEKKLWSDCVRGIDKANVYLWNVIRKKYNLSAIMDYLS